MSICGKSDHCCYFKGEVCQYLREDTEGEYRFRCSLVESKGSWELVALSDEYINNVKPRMVNAGYPDVNCWEWPPEGITCGTCGQVGIHPVKVT